jgi:hypothetical protein
MSDDRYSISYPAHRLLNTMLLPGRLIVGVIRSIGGDDLQACYGETNNGPAPQGAMGKPMASPAPPPKKCTCK